LHDVVVVGGGPAGSVCAARLAMLGRRVVVLERERHPRFHLGESLLPNSLGVLEAVGVLDEVRDRFLVKRGARFVDGLYEGLTRRYVFAEAYHARWGHAFQVPRDAFDELLFRRAGACGAELREGWTGVRVAREGARAVGVVARDPGATELGPVEAGDGTYCTPQDAPNGTYRRALLLLRNAAALKGADYVELVSVTEPHQQTWQCYDHRYMIQAMAFRLPAARQKPAGEAPETDDDACDPPCSPGYACEDSECVAVCNPECSAGQTCRKDRTCGPAD